MMVSGLLAGEKRKYSMEEEDYGYGSSGDDELLSSISENYLEFEESDDDGESEQASSCKVIRKESLLAAQKDELQRVMDMLSLKEHHARTLLIHYRWDADRVFAVFIEKGKEDMFAEAGLSVMESNTNNSSHILSWITCEICYEELPAKEATTMECGHCFCNECWTEYFKVKINEGQSRRLTCMAHKCNSICDEGNVRDLLNARYPQLTEKFDHFLLGSYIEDNKRVKWCPSVPHCGNAIRVKNDQYCEVECPCGLQFCFSCSSEAHSPCSCLMWSIWLKKCQDESETVNWIIVNTQPCPKCCKPVQKNGGCNLVKCICGQPFCWLCGGATGLAHDWNKIDNHECGRYKMEHVEELEHAKEALCRYTHYHDRYKGHLHSLKLEEDLKEKLQQKMATLESRELVVKDNGWMLDGFYRLTRSRRFLLYTYPFAYLMFGDKRFTNETSLEQKAIKQNLFEDQQQQLEANIERLSKFLEQPFEEYPESKVLEVTKNVKDFSKAIDNFCRKLHKCIENELLFPLQQTNHILAPYRSNGVEKASELQECLT